MMNEAERMFARKMRQNARRAERKAAKKERVKKAIAVQASDIGQPLKRNELAADRAIVNSLAKKFNLDL